MTGKLVKWVLAALGAALALAAAYALLLANPLQYGGGAVVFVEREPTDIRTLRVTNEYGSYEVFAEEDGYTLDDIPAAVVEVEGFYELMYHGCAFGALRCVEEAPADLSIYGLDEPQALIEVEFADGEAFRMTLGGEERVSGNYYGQVEGDRAVYLFSEEDMVYFLCRKEAYITRQVTPELAVSSPLSAIRDIRFSGAALEKPIVVEAVTEANAEVALLAKSFGPATHIVRMKGVYELDQSYGAEMLGAVLGIEALDVVGYNLSDADLSRLGFDEPHMRVSFGLKNGTDYIADYELSLVPLQEYFMAHMKGSGVVYLIERPAFVDIDYTRLCQRWFLAPLRLDLESLSVRFDGESYTYESGRSEDGAQYARVNGQEMDIELFYSFYRLVTSAAMDGQYLEDAAAEGEPLMTITYTYIDAAKAPDVMTLYAGSARRVNVDVNGVIEFDMKASFVDAMKLACAHTLTGEAIEENW
ncbi:MAG: DUF4340 domain-containing protein [Clostridia bacterium]|nr:DUF4340 domain-containing protein [Clostridia bacterium]